MYVAKMTSLLSYVFNRLSKSVCIDRLTNPGMGGHHGFIQPWDYSIQGRQHHVWGRLWYVGIDAWNRIGLWWYLNNRMNITENKRSSIGQLCRHWWRRMLTLRQITVPPVMTKLSNDILFSVIVFNSFIAMGNYFIQFLDSRNPSQGLHVNWSKTCRPGNFPKRK